MSKYYNSKELPVADIFEDLLHVAFNCRWEGENIVSRKLGTIKQENMSLLLAWPGILMFKLAEIAGDASYQNFNNELIKMLNDDADYDQIRSFLNTAIVPKKIPKVFYENYKEYLKNNDEEILLKLKKETIGYVPKILETVLLLVNFDNMKFTLDENVLVLIHSLSAYYILCFMIMRSFERNDQDILITTTEMKELYRKIGLVDQLDIYGISAIWSDYLSKIIDLEIDRFIEPKKKENKFKIYNTSEICTQSIKMFIHRIFPENIFAYINEFGDEKTSIIDKNINGFGYNVGRHLNSDCEIWKIYRFNNKNSNGYLFFNKNNNCKDLVSALTTELVKFARISTYAVKSITNSWQYFLNDPYKIIEKNLENYDNWISSILFGSYQTRDEFFKFKPFSRIIGDADTELDYEIINEVRNIYKQGKKYHIPIEHRNKLLEAKEELDHFISSIFKAKMHYNEDDQIQYFNATRSKYTYINLLGESDIKTIVFSTEANAIRDNHRNILTIINKKLGGKNYNKSTLTKLLGLEQGKEEYLKFAR